MSVIKEDKSYIVKLRGLPWSATVEDVKKFLGGEGIERVHLTLSKEGRPSGEAFVELDSESALQKAETKDKAHMGNRYIEGEFELFLSAVLCKYALSSFQS